MSDNAAAPRTWAAFIIKATAIVAGVLAIALIAAAATFISRHITYTEMAVGSARGEIDRVRERVAGQRPLLELSGQGIVRHPTPERSATPIQYFHMLLYDVGDGELTRVDAPGWGLRFIPSLSGISMIEKLEAATGSGMQITLDDLERHGPGLIIDVRRPETLAVAWLE